nr:hypothetical protein [Tanacetum cinerariifolium]
MMGALSVEPSPHVFKKKSLISMEVVMELHNGGCFWSATREAVKEDDKGDDAAGGDAVMKGLEIPFPGYESVYLPVGYQGYMHQGYEYHLTPLKMTLSDCSCSV